MTLVLSQSSYSIDEVQGGLEIGKGEGPFQMVVVDRLPTSKLIQ